jgi:Protein of unknown function VcgC/VcgE (DUF2780)
MSSTRLPTRTAALLALALVWSAAPALAGGLMEMLTGQLGVSQQQASGGIGALLDVAKQNLAGADYGRLMAGAPDLATLAGAAAPAAPQSSGGLGGLLGSAHSLLGGSSGGLGQMARLTQTFHQLGLSPDMVGKFAKVAMDYVQGTGGSALTKLLAGALHM